MNENVQLLFNSAQYSIDNASKRALLLSELQALTANHYLNSENYNNILYNLDINPENVFSDISEIPFLPVRLFKTLTLRSVKDTDVLKTLTSSGTTNQNVARISIDRETSILQTKALASIVMSFLGRQRLPMIIIDNEDVIKNKSSMSARGAGLVGLSNFGRNHFYALNEDMSLRIEQLNQFLKEFAGGKILLFGFTFMIWQYLYNQLKDADSKVDLSKAILFHSGGWKKLIDQSVSNEVFKKKLFESTGIRSVYNFYGMVEQMGNICVECEEGYLHAPNFSEILVRDYKTWNTLEIGETGVIQTLSVLPRSYPGHSLLTEDIGRVVGIDNCGCGRKGTYFTIQGRIPKAELRGCSDTHAEQLIINQSVPG